MQTGSQEMASCEIGCMYLLNKSRIQNEMPYLNWLYNFLCKDILSDLNLKEVDVKEKIKETWSDLSNQQGYFSLCDQIL